MMTEFDIQDTEFEGLKVVIPFYMEDNRGTFLKSFEKDIYKKFGLNGDIYEDFESYSKKNVIRGLHFQTKNPQIKIVRAIKGRVNDVVVDLRKDSKTFGKYLSFELSDENHYSLWIPAGFAHGFCVLSEEGAIVSYKCIGKYLKGYDTGIKWNDTDLNIDWPIDSPVISERDKSLMSFKEFATKFNGL